jgi:RNA polymerase sigma-70 factor (ECF subfamily)
MQQEGAPMQELGDLLADARRGEISAFGGIVERTADEVRAFIAAFCPNAAAIDDLAQVTYLRAYQKLAGCEEVSKLLPWLRGIARNVVFEELRSRRRERTVGEEALESLLDRKAEESLQDTETDQRLAHLVRCLGKVAEGPRRLLEEFYVTGRRSEDIAESFGKSAAWVRVTLLRLRRRLAECVMAGLREELT